MTERDDIDMLAAEYVLGTLDAVERRAVTERRPGDAALEAAIRDWERRLAPLTGEVEAVTPPATLFPRIEARLGVERDRRQIGGPGPVLLPETETKPVVVLDLERRLRSWRRAAVAASAIAAALLLTIGLRESVWQPARQASNYVAVFQKDDAQPAFLLSIDLLSREVTIRPVTADRQPPERTYQLWILAEPLGPVPRSLGLLDDGSQPTRKSLAAFEPALLQKAVFGISVEPKGGSTTGRPSTGALHGRLLPAVP